MITIDQWKCFMNNFSFPFRTEDALNLWSEIINNRMRNETRNGKNIMNSQFSNFTPTFYYFLYKRLRRAFQNPILCQRVEIIIVPNQYRGRAPINFEFLCKIRVTDAQKHFPPHKQTQPTSYNTKAPKKMNRLPFYFFRIVFICYLHNFPIKVWNALCFALCDSKRTVVALIVDEKKGIKKKNTKKQWFLLEYFCWMS